MPAESVPVPASVPSKARLPTVSLPPRLSVAPLFTATADVSGSKLAAVVASVPASTVVPPL